jgi:hypothetical protein
MSSYLAGGHEIWFDLKANDETATPANLPRYIADRSVAVAPGVNPGPEVICQTGEADLQDAVSPASSGSDIFIVGTT